MRSRFPSRVWSCGDLTRGAAAVVDRAAMDGEMSKSAVVGCKRSLLSETRGMSLPELQKMLQDPRWHTVLTSLKKTQVPILKIMRSSPWLLHMFFFKYRHFCIFLWKSHTNCKLHSCCPLLQKTHKIITKKTS